MSNQHPGTTTARDSSSKQQQSNKPKAGVARKSPTVLKLEAEVLALRQDAERYRWLDGQAGVVWIGLAKVADRKACIDAVMRQE